MKKISNNLILIVFTIITFSCSNNNESIDEPITDNALSVQYFDSKETFDTKMQSIIANNSDQLMTDDQYDILSEVLNKDHIIGIGDYLIKIDFETNSVYTLQKSLLNQYDDLAGINLKNNNITKYSIYDNVLGILSGEETAQKSCTSQSPANYDYDFDSVSGNNVSLKLTARYFASGIYFILSYHCVPNTEYGYCRLDEWDITYKTKGCQYYSSYGENDYGDGEHEGSFSSTRYLGFSPLVNFHCFVVCSSSAGTVDVTIES